MCGICGSFGVEGVRVSQLAYPAMHALQHRGPDDRGLYSDEICSLGHQRLAIIDLSANGRQPMSNADGSVVIIVNGEIYNYRELRQELEGKHTFMSQSDSEVILHAYEAYGYDFVTKLRGMFALAVYDRNKRKLLLARDPIGKKPLYYAEYRGGLLFASEAKGILAMGYPAKVNYNMIPSYLMYQHVLGSETLLEGIKMLPAGNLLIAYRGEDPVIRPYWRLHRWYDIPDAEAVPKLGEVLDDAVQLRLRSDVPIGSFLSGGLDSSVVLALYREHYSGALHTFTATFPEHSEALFAKQVSQHVGAEYHEVVITPEMLARDIHKITWHHDYPLGDAATANNYYLSQEAKKYVTVVLAGEGGDEVFGGYPYHRYYPYVRLMDAIPASLRRMGSSLLSAAGVADLSSRAYGLGRVALFPCQEDRDTMLLYPTTATSRITVKWLLGWDGLPLSSILPISPILPAEDIKGYDRMLAMDCLNLLQKFLMKADKATMAHAVEERLPLLDTRVLETAFSLSPKMRKDKYVLRKVAEELLPHDIAWRPKQGFGTPIGSWLASEELGSVVSDRLHNGTLLRDICRPEALHKVWGLLDTLQHKPGLMSLKPANVIWSLFALQVWHDVWFGGTEKGIGWMR